MKLGRVVGTVVSSRKDAGLEGASLFLVKDLGPDGKLKDAFVVAVDSVGAGVGETVLYASGSSARQTESTQGKPVDAVIMAIVDTVDIDGKRIYDKTQDA